MPSFLWTQKQDFGPRARTGHSLAFDSRRNQTVLFGGASSNGGLFNDTWEWDGEFWTQMGDMGPSPRKDHAMAYDANTNRTVLFGGTTDVSLQGDTWTWDGEAWTQLSNSGPSRRSGHRMIFHQSRNTVILFGGETGNGSILGDTWEFNGVDWTQLDETGPVPRKFHSMTYDNLRHRIVLFGGMSVDSQFNDTWEWNGTSWVQVADFGPDHCLGAAMAFTRSRATLFGGISSLNINPGPSIYNKSWDWDGRHWTQRQDIGPLHRWGHALCYDSRRTTLVLFGGMSAFPENPEGVLGDTWEHLDTLAAAPPPDPGNPAIQPMVEMLQVSPESISEAAVPTAVISVGVIMTVPVIDVPLTIPLFFVTQQQAENQPLPEGVEPTALPPIVVEVGSQTGQVELMPGTLTESSVIFTSQPNDPGSVQSVNFSVL